MDADTINEATFHVVDRNGNRVGGTVTYEPQSRIASFTPPAPAAGLAPRESFVATIESGSAGVQDAAGNALTSNKTWSFETGSEPCSTVADLGTAESFAALSGGAASSTTASAQ